MRKCVEILSTPTAYVSPHAVPNSESTMSMTESMSGDLSDISSSINDADNRCVTNFRDIFVLPEKCSDTW